MESNSKVTKEHPKNIVDDGLPDAILIDYWGTIPDLVNNLW